MTSKGIDDLATISFTALPRERLAPSALVDFLHLIALGKPAVRVRVHEQAGQGLALWCAEYNYKWRSDPEGFFCASPKEAVAIKVLAVDQRAEAHELELGLLLGYPPCCCEAVSRVGESRIDEQAIALMSWEFRHRFQLINPSGYLQGASLICHLPCSPHCKASLGIALRAAIFLKKRLGIPAFASWLQWKEPLQRLL